MAYSIRARPGLDDRRRPDRRIPLVIVAIQAILRRVVPALKKTEHNEVAGFLVAVIGVVYAVIAGFTIIALWENFTEAQNATKVEALGATPLEQGVGSWGGATRGQAAQGDHCL